jgi:hypothetical protein
MTKHFIVGYYQESKSSKFLTRELFAKEICMSKSWIHFGLAPTDPS